MSVADRYVVDHITRSETGDQYTLVMVEDRPLDAPGLVEETLQKVNEYLQIIASGAFVREVPEASGAALEVQYNVLDDPESSPELMALLGSANALFASNGIDFAVAHLNV